LEPQFAPSSQPIVVMAGFPNQEEFRRERRISGSQGVIETTD